MDLKNLLCASADILYDSWSPAMTVSSICISILSMLSSSTVKVILKFGHFDIAAVMSYVYLQMATFVLFVSVLMNMYIVEFVWLRNKFRY